MTGKEIIQAERQRQIEKEGWAIEHDDSHINGELSKAADCYFYYAEDNDYNDNALPDGWPWDAEYWKPKNQLADYTRAGALYLAELQRLERRGGDVGPTLTRLRISRKSCEITIDELHRQIGAAKFIIPSKETNQASTTLPGGETGSKSPFDTIAERIGHEDMADDEIEANAKLISAAPELLEALRGLLTFCKSHNMDNYYTEQAEKVINTSLQG